MVTNCYPECTRTHHFDIKIQKIFSLDPTPSGEGDTPSSHPTPLGAHCILPIIAILTKETKMLQPDLRAYNTAMSKMRLQPSDWPVYRDLVITSPYDDVIIHKLQYATT